MNPRELDALVAAKVMGWEIINEVAGRPPDGGPNEHYSIPKYSEDYLDALHVFEKCEKMSIICYHTGKGPTYEAKIYRTGERYRYQSLPLAVCYAALRSKGIKVGEPVIPVWRKKA